MESVSLARYAVVSTADTGFANAKIYSTQTQTQIANAGENARTHANAGREKMVVVVGDSLHACLATYAT